MAPPTAADRVWQFVTNYPKPFDLDTAEDHIGRLGGPTSRRSIRDRLNFIVERTELLERETVGDRGRLRYYRPDMKE